MKMKAYLWHEIDKVSDNYHKSGSVLIQAESLERAVEISQGINTDLNALKMKGTDEMPNAIFEALTENEAIWVFPDAGCC